MNENGVTPLPSRVLPWPLPLPEGSSPATVIAMVEAASKEFARVSASLGRLRDPIATELRERPDGYDTEAVADAVHEQLVGPVQERGVLSKPWLDVLYRYVDIVKVTAALLPEWVGAAERLEALEAATFELEDQVSSLVNDVVEADIARRTGNDRCRATS